MSYRNKQNGFNQSRYIDDEKHLHIYEQYNQRNKSFGRYNDTDRNMCASNTLMFIFFFFLIVLICGIFSIYTVRNIIVDIKESDVKSKPHGGVFSFKIDINILYKSANFHVENYTSIKRGPIPGFLAGVCARYNMRCEYCGKPAAIGNDMDNGDGDIICSGFNDYLHVYITKNFKNKIEVCRKNGTLNKNKKRFVKCVFRWSIYKKEKKIKINTDIKK